MAGLGFAQDMAQGLLATRRTFVLLRCNECQAHGVPVAWARHNPQLPRKATEHLDKLEMISRWLLQLLVKAMATAAGGGGARGPHGCAPQLLHTSARMSGTTQWVSCGVAK